MMHVFENVGGIAGAQDAMKLPTSSDSVQQ
jgi:hypothetical protein